MVIAWHGNAASVLDRPGHHGGRVPVGLCARVVQRLLALNTAICPQLAMGPSVKRSLIAYDHWAARASGQRSSWAKGDLGLAAARTYSGEGGFGQAAHTCLGEGDLGQAAARA